MNIKLLFLTGLVLAVFLRPMQAAPGETPLQSPSNITYFQTLNIAGQAPVVHVKIDASRKNAYARYYEVKTTLGHIEQATLYIDQQPVTIISYEYFETGSLKRKTVIDHRSKMIIISDFLKSGQLCREDRDTLNNYPGVW